jgi:nucleoside-diphosphate-sugar epimerase
MHSNQTKHIIITGANGFIGSALVNYFYKKDYAVTALVRKIPSNPIPTVDYQLYRLESNSDMDFLTSNSIVIHCAYSKKEMVIDNKDVNELAAQHLLNEAQKHNIKKCVFISSVSVTSNSDSYYAKQKTKLELLFNSANYLIVRPSLVVGNDGLFFKTLSNLKKTRILPLINGGNQPIYYVGIVDLVRFIGDCIEKKSSGIHVVSNPKPISYKEFYLKISNQLGFKIVSLPIPLSLLKLAVFLNSFLPKPIVTQDNLKGFLSTSKLDMDLKSDFNYQSIEEILSNFKW